MLTIFLSATEESQDTYSLVDSILRKMEEDGSIFVYRFPGSNDGFQLTHFPKMIMMALDKSNVVVAILDQVGINNQWVNQEVGYAMANGKQVLAIAEDRNELKGFVNKNATTIIETSEISEQLMDQINRFGEQYEEAIFESIIDGKISDIGKLIDYEDSQLKRISEYNAEISALDSIEKLLKIVRDQKEEVGYYPIRNLDRFLAVINNIEELRFTGGFKRIMGEFESDIENLREARKRKYS